MELHTSANLQPPTWKLLWIPGLNPVGPLSCGNDRITVGACYNPYPLLKYKACYPKKLRMRVIKGDLAWEGLGGFQQGLHVDGRPLETGGESKDMSVDFI